MIKLMQFQPVHVDEIIQLSRRLENDPVPTSYWGLNSESAGQLLENPNKQSFVALLDNAVIGIGTLTRGEMYQFHLAEISIAVDSRQRKNGVARTIVQQLEKTAQGHKIELLKAFISTHNI